MNKRLIFFCLLTLLWMGVLICTHAQTEYLIKVAKPDSVKFNSFVTFEEKNLIQVKVKPNELKQVYLPKGQNILPGVITIDAPLDVNKSWVYEIIAKEVGVVVPPVDPPVDTKIDNIKATKSTTWQHNTTTGAVGWHDGTSAYSNVPGSTLTFSFTGTKIELWAERLPNVPTKPAASNHGTGVVTVTQGITVVETKSVTFVGPKALPVLIYSSPVLQALPHTITLKVTSGYCLLDFFVVQNYVPASGNVDPPPPTGNIINVLPGESLKKIESTPSGTTVMISAGTFTENMVNVPIGVNVRGAGETKTFVNATGAYPNNENAVFLIRSDGRVEGNQTFEGLTINGQNKAKGGFKVDNRNNVHVKNVKVINCTFQGAWMKNSANSTMKFLDLYENSWSSNEWSSGELVIGNLVNCTIEDVKMQSVSGNKGYAMKVMPTHMALTNVKIIRPYVKMNHKSLWQNGLSKNIGIEMADTHYNGVEITDGIFYNQMSLASGKDIPSRILVRNCAFILEGDTYGIETILNGLEVAYCTFDGGQMFLANFRRNMKGKNWNIHHNIFRNPAGPANWTGVILVGESGVENVHLHHNELTVRGQPDIRYRDVRGGINIDNTNIINQ